MRLLQINSVYEFGSTGRIVKDIHLEALKKGIESYVAYGRGQHKNNKLIKIGSKKDLIYHGLKTRFFDQHGLASKNATRKFIEQIQHLKLDIIHLHNIHGYYFNYPVFFEYLKTNDIKVIWTMHDCWAFTGHCTHYTYAECSKWETHCGKCPELRQYPKSLKFDNSYNNFEQKKKSFRGLSNLKIVTDSNWLSDQLGKSFLNTYPILTIHNGIDLELFRPVKSDFKERYKIIDKKIILGVASVWSKRKGLDYFLEISELLREDEIIVLVGIELKKYPKIISIKRTTDVQELVEIYSSADVFFNPTLEETFGLVNIEAIACGAPVVSFDSGGTPETICKNFGKLINTRDVRKILEQLRKTYALKFNYKDEEITQLSKEFDMKNMLKNVFELYDRV
jgi:glycosyltransferase involved in cell wall biosynthesis